jgi:hypothetical protein
MRRIVFAAALVALASPQIAEGAGAGPVPSSTTSTTSTATPNVGPPPPTSPPGKDQEPKKTAVSYQNQTVLYLAESLHGIEKVDRAKRASRALSSALESKDPAMPGAHVAEVRTISSSTVALYVRGYLITELYDADAHAAGYATLQEYAKDIDDSIGLYVADNLRRRALQGFALRLFFAVIIALVGLISFRVLARLFDRADEFIYERRASLRPVTILRVPIVSQETLGAAVTFALAIGRVVVYVAASVATLSLILAQFDATRAWVGRAIAWGTAPMLSALEALGRALPGLVLAAALFVALKAILRVFGLLLDSVAEGRESLRGVTPERVRVLRAILPIGAVILVAPLIVASAFGSFHTPLEIITIAAAAAGAIAFVPMLAAGIVGLMVLWRHAIRVGDWLQIGDVGGRVVEVSPWEIVFDRGRDMRAVVPMLAILFRPMNKSIVHPRVALDVVAKHDRPLREVFGEIERIVRGVDEAAELSISGYTAEAVRVRIETKSQNLDARQAMLLALSDAKTIAVTEARVI